MQSVTQRIKNIKQPRGGYIKPRDFTVTQLDDGLELFPQENIHSSLVGLVVDYMTRFTLGARVEDAFNISILGSRIIDDEKNSSKLLNLIRGLDDESIINACKLVGYDVCYRAGRMGYKPVSEINPDLYTINNIKIMINRSIKFFEIYGPITKDGFTFEGGYTGIVSKGDGDFLTKDTLWDFKVSVKAPTTAHTLQLLMYYLMGRHSIHEEFKTITKLGVFNPRLNKVYLLEVDNISSDIINEVSIDVIGY